ncbi:MAG TPA: hypothetical protein VL119_04870 [Acidimicrobiia bacterium]|nr:hypothetical protein [Acidimicrobiia bacterium]
MPIVYRADRALGCTFVVWDGDLTSRDMQRHLRRLSGDADWPAGPRHLVDGTTIKTVAMPAPDLLELLYEGTNLVREMRIAAIVRPDFVDAGGVLYKTATHEFHVATFTDLDAASEYLDLDSTAVHAVIDELRCQL